MAADDEAVSSFRDALDLAAALIKLSRQAPAQPCAELATALLHSSTESLKVRVQRLFIWNSARPGTELARIHGGTRLRLYLLPLRDCNVLSLGPGPHACSDRVVGTVTRTFSPAPDRLPNQDAATRLGRSMRQAARVEGRQVLPRLLPSPSRVQLQATRRRIETRS